VALVECEETGELDDGMPASCPDCDASRGSLAEVKED
jgi:hypothetical protein